MIQSKKLIFPLIAAGLMIAHVPVQAMNTELITKNTVNLCQPWFNAVLKHSGKFYKTAVQENPVTTVAFTVGGLGLVTSIYFNYRFYKSNNNLKTVNGLLSNEKAELGNKVKNVQSLVLSLVKNTDKTGIKINPHNVGYRELSGDMQIELNQGVGSANKRIADEKAEENKVYIVNQVVPYTIEAVLQKRKEAVGLNELPIDTKDDYKENELYKKLNEKEKSIFDHCIAMGQDELNTRVNAACDENRQLFYTKLFHNAFVLIGGSKIRDEYIKRIRSKKEETVFKDVPNDVIEEVIKNTDSINQEGEAVWRKSVHEAVEQQVVHLNTEIKELKKEKNELKFENTQQVRTIVSQRAGLIELVENMNNMQNAINSSAPSYFNVNSIWNKAITTIKKFIPDYIPGLNPVVKDIDEKKGKEKVKSSGDMKQSVSLDDWDLTYHSLMPHQDHQTRFFVEDTKKDALRNENEALRSEIEKLKISNLNDTIGMNGSFLES